MKRPELMVVVLALTLVAAGQSKADFISLGTADNASNWHFTGAGVVNAQAFQLNDQISITSNGNSTGGLVPNSTENLSKFDGFWSADETFYLPANAYNVVFTFSGLLADDRVVAELNGTIIGAAGITTGANGGGATTGSGYMTLTDSNSQTSFTFNSSGAATMDSGAPSGTITSGFNLGGENTLTLIVNNTHGGIGGTTRGFADPGDYTDAEITASVSYNVAPEPSGLALIASAGASFLGYFGSRRRKVVPV